MAAASSSSDVFAYLVAIFLPPLAVFLKTGCNADFLINIGLSILGWIPGVIHAWWVISKHDPAKYGVSTATV